MLLRNRHLPIGTDTHLDFVGTQDFGDPFQFLRRQLLGEKVERFAFRFEILVRVDTRAVDRAGLRALVERVGRPLVEVVSPSFLSIRVDPHILAHGGKESSFFD